MIREAILEYMRTHENAEGKKLTAYQVAQMVKGKVSQHTVYAFLSEEHGKDARTKAASLIMEALGLVVAEGPRPRFRKIKTRKK